VIIVKGKIFIGLCTKIKLQSPNIKKFIIHEINGEIGGTWRKHYFLGIALGVPLFVSIFV
jgi:cation diffusion facilitator CzcD-associated flavoprotein CzcO